MDVLSGWLLAVFRKRMDVLDQQITQKNRQTGKQKCMMELHDRFCQTLSEEQRLLFFEWEACKNDVASEEREEWYFSGMSDGMGLSMGMDELSRSLPGHETRQGS